MQLVITPEESARLDAAAAEPVDVLMERAGLGVALAAVDLGAGYGSRVSVLAGKGNNGGDGYVAARYLARRGCLVTVHALGDASSDAAKQAAERAVASGVTVTRLGDPIEADVVVDALFGAGFRGQLPDAAVPWVGPAARVVAVDVPSGLDAGTGAVDGPVFEADITVTFHALKPGHLLGVGPEVCGDVRVVDIGLDGGVAEFHVCEEVDASRPARSRTAHKWSAGSVAVVGGSPGITGAPLLAARAALSMGAGAVTLLCPRALQPTYAGASAEIMTRGIGTGPRFTDGDAAEVLESAERFDVLVVGPGLGGAQSTFVADILDKWAGSLVVDADGINALAGTDLLAERTSPTIITPHAGEFTRLTGEEATYRNAAEIPDAAGAVVVLKGNPTFVLGADRWLVRSGGAELATIGTGDVLAGMIGALWARGLEAEVAARSAAYWHGVAGADLARRGAVTAERLTDAVATYAF